MSRLTSVLIILINLACGLSGNAQGLRFKGLDEPIDGRTSLKVFGDKPVAFKDSLVVECDTKLYSQYAYGYLGQVICTANDVRHPINLFCNGQDNPDTVSFNLILEGRKVLTRIDVPKSEIRGRWIHSRIKFDFTTGVASMQIGDRFSSSGGFPIVDKAKVSITLGRFPSQTDVPKFLLRNLGVYSTGKEIFFPLDEDSGNYAYSSKGHHRAEVINPIWRRQTNRDWALRIERKSDSYQTVGYDAVTNDIYIVDKDSLFLFDLVEFKMHPYLLPAPCPVDVKLGTSTVDPVSGDICVYEHFATPPYVSTEPSMASLDLKTYEWDVKSYDSSMLPLHHHSVVVDSLKNRMVIFGGFGSRSYNGTFYEMGLDGGNWKAMPPVAGDELWPRFQHAMGFDPTSRQAYIFGGVGSINGEQVLRQYIYTLHVVNLDTMECHKLWEIPWPGSNKVATRGMVLDGDGNMYVLMYTESTTDSELYLYRFSLLDGSYEVFGSGIPIYSDRITCQANLYYDPLLARLIATVEESSDDVKTRVTAYFMSFPPEHAGVSTVAHRNRRIALLVVVLALLGLLLLGFIVKEIYFAVKARWSSASKVDVPSAGPNSVCLFGDFAAYDRDGNDISADFSAKLRQMLCIFLRNVDGGITTQRLTDVFWPDRDDDKAKNIRGVMINNFRKVISKFDGVHLRFENGRYTLELSDSFNCDYLVVKSILSSKNPDMNSCIAMLSRGHFLQSETDPVLDKMKNDMAALVEPMLQLEIVRRFAMKQYSVVLICADILSGVNPFSEEALTYAVRSLCAMDKRDDAVLLYHDFVTRYNTAHKEVYGRSFEGVVGV